MQVGWVKIGHFRPGLHADWPLGAVAAPWEYSTAAHGQSGMARIPERSDELRTNFVEPGINRYQL